MQNKRGRMSSLCNFFKKNRKGQVTIFIIVAILIVAGVVAFFLVRQNITIQQIPTSIQPVYASFLSCIEERTKVGIDILESQAGYIELPAFESGSPYMPFSSQLNFLGNPIPYWYYVSGNNIQKEQVPTLKQMQDSLAKFVDEGISQCNFDSYYSQGFQINQSTPTSTVTINGGNVMVNTNMNMQISFAGDSAVISSHNALVNSNLGNLYDSAKVLYQKEQSELFLENYGLDTLRLSSPVDGVEITCSPKTWDANKVFDNLKQSIETNTLALSTQTPTTKDGQYFYVNVGNNINARFINSEIWANSFEVNPSQDSLLIATPVGNQQGLGILGFCYVPYHFVYNVNYPVLIQVYSGTETFQFPVAVVIQGNEARQSLNSTASSTSLNLCPNANTQTIVKTYDTNLNPVESSISYECFGETCNIGNTASGTLTKDFPQCVNGYIVAKANGYKDTKYLYSTTSEGSASIILDKLYNLSINLKVDGINYNGQAIIYFNSIGDSKAISYPEQRSVQLAEGDYNISTYIYKNSSIQLSQTTTQKCIDVPSSGIGGFFGFTEKNCFDVTVPSQMISNVLAGGGNQEYYFLENDLKNSKTIEINAKSLTIPKTVQDLQNNYIIFDDQKLEVNIK
ncbi:Uncharacterised protein [uncultured archaeon]|nr:Uncharacterised protein [uncultured archaeon]